MTRACLLLAPAFVLTLGCAEPDDPGPTVDFEAEVQPIFNAICTCHLQGPSGTMEADYMTLNPGVSHGQIVDVPAEGPTEPIDRVEPGDPERSYLWRKINDTHLEVGGVETRMPPPPAPPLDPEDLDTLETWIVSGAAP